MKFLKSAGLSATAIMLTLVSAARADGVSAYIPLNLEPEIERQIERVLILADEPILKRPFAVALVQLALPKACERDRPLSERVEKYLDRYSRDYALTHSSVTGAYTNGANGTVPNNHGLPVQSNWEVSALGFVEPNDYMLAQAGIVAYDGRVMPTGSMLSFGFNWAQLDIGYRDHWMSPMTDSSMMIGTESPTMPSVTLSNYEPLTRLGFQYELFLARMSTQNDILTGGQGTDIRARGNPKLFGAQFSIEPFSGWSLGINRTLQYGGGGLPDTAHFLLSDFFKPAGGNQLLGNQEASYISRFIFPAKTPFAFYVEYAGEDTSDGGSYLLGNTSTNVGIDFPRIGRYFDLTFEVSEWQNSWYTNTTFLDGRINDGLVLGHWGADQRKLNDPVGARSEMLRVGWEPPFTGYLEARVRYLVNQEYGFFYPYKHYSDFTLRYSRPWNGMTVGTEALAGSDVYGKSFVRLSGFVRYGEDGHSRTVDPEGDDSSASTEVAGNELFIDAGFNANKIKVNLQKGLPVTTTPVGFGEHIGLGARRAVSERNDLGVRVEFDQVDGHSLIGVRPVDYRHRFGDSFAVGLFAGVARYDLATPAYSLYAGAGAQWRNVLPKWDLGADFRYAQNVARDHVLASDDAIVGVRPESFYKIETALFYVTRHF